MIRLTAAAAKEAARIPREARSHRPLPPTTGLVVEVGGGQSPHPRADVVVDKYVADSFERAGEAALDVSKPLVVADGEHLPFATGSAAYILAIHVLEHARDPSAFAAELSRVAPAGFIQVPSADAELTFGWPYHAWLIERSGDALRFTPKGGRRAPRGELFHRSFAEEPLMQLWWMAHRSRWHHSVEWRETIDVAVASTAVPEDTAFFDLERTRIALEDLKVPSPLHEPIRGALCCPRCHGQLSYAPSTAECRGCGRRYPIVAEVPVLLEEAATPP